jgi:hypothetical protein
LRDVSCGSGDTNVAKSDLLGIVCLLDKVDDGLGEGLIGDGPGWGIVSRSASRALSLGGILPAVESSAIVAFGRKFRTPDLEKKWLTRRITAVLYNGNSRALKVEDQESETGNFLGWEWWSIFTAFSLELSLR